MGIWDPSPTQGSGTWNNKPSGIPNSDKDRGVKTATSVTKLQTIRPGNGPKPVDGDIVRVHFTGMTKTGLRNGSSRGVGKGTPPTFKVGEGAIMKALDEVVKQMSAGETAKFECPEDLAVNSGEHEHRFSSQSRHKGGDVLLDVQLFSVNGNPKTRWDNLWMPAVQGTFGELISHSSLTRHRQAPGIRRPEVARWVSESHDHM